MSRLAKYSSDLDAIIRSTLDLTKQGFQYSGVSEANTKATGDYLEATFTHPQTHRRVTITYFPEPSDPRARPALLVHIARDADDPHSGTFSVGSYLKHVRADPKLIESIQLRTHATSGSRGIMEVLTQIANIIRMDLAAVVSGAAWVRIPIDWSDYK